MFLAVTAPWLGVITWLVIDMAEVTPERTLVRHTQLGPAHLTPVLSQRGRRPGPGCETPSNVIRVTKEGWAEVMQHSKRVHKAELQLGSKRVRCSLLTLESSSSSCAD